MFANYFLKQNAAIAAGKQKGTTINLKTLGVGNGLTDPLSQYPEYMVYAATNPYRPTVSNSVIERANNSFYEAGGCQSLVSLNLWRYGVNIYLFGTHAMCLRI